jgi:hypothetical protein|tara:strand:+ start:885 stop:1052 length:168 start_codon:yes stop_codon:yes gene_type:complete
MNIRELKRLEKQVEDTKPKSLVAYVHVIDWSNAVATHVKARRALEDYIFKKGSKV